MSLYSDGTTYKIDWPTIGFSQGKINTSTIGDRTFSIGFKPRYIEFIGGYNSSDASNSSSTGYYDGTEQYTFANTSRNQSQNASASRYFENACLIVIAFPASGAAIYDVRVNGVSVSDDGFVVNVSTASTISTVRYRAYQ